MLKNPLISVVLCNYNYGHIIQDNLNGLLSQSYKNWEAIIVDDGSTDNSHSIISEFAEKDSRFKPIFLDKNVGIQEAVKIGNAAIAGEIYYGSASDDFICNPEFFKKAIEEFRFKTEMGVVFFKTRIIDFSDNHHMCDIGYSPKKYLTGKEATRFFFHRVFFVPGSSALVKVKLMRMIGMHEILGPQIDLFLNHAAASVHGCAFIDDVVAVMRYSPQTYGASADFEDQIERHAYLEKYYRNMLKIIDDNPDQEIFKTWRESIINDEKGRIGDFDRLALNVERFFSNLTIEHFTLFKHIIIDYKPKLDEFAKIVKCEVAEKRQKAHEIFDRIAGKIE